MTIEEIGKLLDKYISETITEEERRRLSHLLGTPAGREALEQIIDREFAEGLYERSGDENRFQAIHAYLTAARKQADQTAETGQTIEDALPAASAAGSVSVPGSASVSGSASVPESVSMSGSVSVPGKRRTRRWRLPAAAAVLICLGGWLYYFYNSGGAPPGSPLVHAQPAHDALPGKYGALLTLSDGSQIPLDSSTPRRIDIAGNAVVLKEGEQLRYHNEAAGPASEQLYHTLSTSKGEVYSLTLSDGSKVWLNSASSIRFPVAFGASREVAVTGEAYFEVARDTQKKFLVDAGGVVTEVLGTKFNVNVYADEPRTAITLLEGSVRISNEAHSMQLRPGQQLRIAGEMAERRVAEPDVVSNIDALAVVAWKDGYFHFNEADLATVMRQLMRWYDVEVVYTADIPKRRFGGKMEKDLLLSQVLKILEKSEVNFTVEGNRLLVSP